MTKYTQKGLTLLEILISVSIAGILIAAISGFINTALNAGQTTHFQNDTQQQARFAMQRMTRAVSKSRQLRLPLGENLNTKCSESVRGDNSDSDANNNCNDIGVLAVALDPTLDRDKDGWADANNDKDFLDVNKSGTRDAGEPEQIDEDTGKDNNNDGASGIKDIDDDGDINADIDGLSTTDNDEDGINNEDSIDGVDNDNPLDGSIDEDIDKDMNGNLKPGITGVDDDYDGAVDDGVIDDDDEDGAVSEDWIDEQVFFLDKTDPNNYKLKERLPDINAVDGADYTEYVIVENVSQFRIERLLGANGSTVLVDITLTLSPPGSQPVILNTRVGVDGGL